MSDGRDVHDAVAKKAALGLNAIYKIWRERKKLTPFIVAWPLRDLDFKSCMPTDSEVTLDLPLDKKDWPACIAQLMKDDVPFALLLAQQKEKEIVLVLESEYGSTSWHIPISKHGPDLSLGQPSMKIDTDSVGLLWKAGQKN
jgi:hypothetical protein